MDPREYVDTVAEEDVTPIELYTESRINSLLNIIPELIQGTNDDVTKIKLVGFYKDLLNAVKLREGGFLYDLGAVKEVIVDKITSLLPQDYIHMVGLLNPVIEKMLRNGTHSYVEMIMAGVGMIKSYANTQHQISEI